MGRTLVSGPFTGAYHEFSITSFSPTNLSPGNGTTIVGYRVAPFACRAVEASAIADLVTIVGSINYIIHNLTQAVDIVAANSFPASDVSEVISATSLTNRNIAKGDVLRFSIVGTNAGDVITRGTLSLSVYATGHVVAAEAND